MSNRTLDIQNSPTHVTFSNLKYGNGNLVILPIGKGIKEKHRRGRSLSQAYETFENEFKAF